MSTRNPAPRKTGENPRAKKPRITPEDYSLFLGQIELHHLWLVSARVENREGPLPPANLKVAIEATGKYINSDEGFDCFVSYRLIFGQAEVNEKASSLDVTFGLRFTSEQPMTDPIFRTFFDLNLPVNTWPFLREFVQSMVTRMNWPSLTLPTFKVHIR